ncbi:MAG: hypothetical protein Q8J65_07970 [Nitrosomonadales bacterium]|nr:hypothetical protein [Nitrosomonadales bacterium]
MISRSTQKLIHGDFICKQQGAALIMFAVLLLLSTTAVFFTYFDSTQYGVERDKRTFTALNEAKAALIGWSVAHPEYPGILPFPDRSNDGDYNGVSDCVNPAITPLNYSHLLGKLPFNNQANPCVGSSLGLAVNLTDGSGEKLWYAVSRNLIRTSVAGPLVINPSIIEAPIYPWIIVRNKSGDIVSDRVAAVIFSPGPAVEGQNRDGGLAGPAAYLDSLTIAGTSYSNASYTVPDEDFIMGEDMKNVPATHPTYQQPYKFNDKLVYITIDELMDSLEKRAIREAAAGLRSYYSSSAAVPASRYYPYAAVLGDNNNLCVEGTLTGVLPIANAASTCTHPNTGLLTLPLWFTESRWQEYLYYAISSDCSFATPGCISGGLTAGPQTNIHALLISVGKILAGQTRPSNVTTNYLDSVENANEDSVFDAVGTPGTENYNDQILIVAP